MTDADDTRPRGSTPVPDPTVLTTQQLQREIAASREIVEAIGTGGRQVIIARLEGMDKAIELLQKTSDKIPSLIQATVNTLQELHDEKFNSIDEQLKIQFSGIGTQFQERDKRTEQLSLADKTAIAAALQAQKEAAGATNEANGAALAKMENNFAKLIDQTQTLLNSVARNTDEKIGDVKSRLDRGEGKVSATDPAIANSISELMMAVKSLNVSRDVQSGAKSQGSASMAIISTVIAGVVAFVVTMGGVIGLVAFVMARH